MNLRRVYETTVIVNAALEDQDIDSVVSKINNYIENHGGEIHEINKWGRRRLAYPINKKYNGFYIHIVFETMPSSVPILERFLVLEDTVLRHLTLLLPQRLIELRTEKALAEGKTGATALITGMDEAKKEAEIRRAEAEKKKAEHKKGEFGFKVREENIKADIENEEDIADIEETPAETNL
jgi:small subunit ribosomal protein S6